MIAIAFATVPAGFLGAPDQVRAATKPLKGGVGSDRAREMGVGGLDVPLADEAVEHVERWIRLDVDALQSQRRIRPRVAEVLDAARAFRGRDGAPSEPQASIASWQLRECREAH